MATAPTTVTTAAAIIPIRRTMPPTGTAIPIATSRARMPRTRHGAITRGAIRTTAIEPSAFGKKAFGRLLRKRDDAADSAPQEAIRRHTADGLGPPVGSGQHVDLPELVHPD